MIEAKLVELDAGSEPKPSAAASSGAPGASSSPAPPIVAPRVDPHFLQQLCDMGFSREHSEEALLTCGNDITTAMEWILSHPPSSEAVQVCACVCVSLIPKL